LTRWPAQSLRVKVRARVCASIARPRVCAIVRGLRRALILSRLIASRVVQLHLPLLRFPIVVLVLRAKRNDAADAAAFVQEQIGECRERKLAATVRVLCRRRGLRLRDARCGLWRAELCERCHRGGFGAWTRRLLGKLRARVGRFLNHGGLLL
jgi:hypothetical protein